MNKAKLTIFFCHGYEKRSEVLGGFKPRITRLDLVEDYGRWLLVEIFLALRGVLGVRFRVLRFRASSSNCMQVFLVARAVFSQVHRHGLKYLFTAPVLVVMPVAQPKCIQPESTTARSPRKCPSRRPNLTDSALRTFLKNTC